MQYKGIWFGGILKLVGLLINLLSTLLHIWWLFLKLADSWRWLPRGFWAAYAVGSLGAFWFGDVLSRAVFVQGHFGWRVFWFRSILPQWHFCLWGYGFGALTWYRLNLLS